MFHPVYQQDIYMYNFLHELIHHQRFDKITPAHNNYFSNQEEFCHQVYIMKQAFDKKCHSHTVL